MSYVDEVIGIICDTLAIDDGRKAEMNADTTLLGGMPEFDSIAVVSLITALEEEYGCTFDDEEITADVFSTIGSFAALVEQKMAA